jgi:hypothetical protein
MSWFWKTSRQSSWNESPIMCHRKQGRVFY